MNNILFSLRNEALGAHNYVASSMRCSKMNCFQKSEMAGQTIAGPIILTMK